MPERMTKKKYLLIFGTRPEAIKMAPIKSALEEDPRADCVVCVTGQHEELLDSALALFGIRPHYRLHVMSHAQELCGLTALLLSELEKVITAERPDWVIVQGDTTSAMAASLAAFYLRVPVAHVEAGLRSYNKLHPFPEEMNRKVIDLIADLHFAPTALDKQDLIREGFRHSSIHVSGNTCIDALRYVSSLPFSTDVLKTLPLTSKRIILVTAHRRENHGEPLERICRAIRIIASRYRDSVHLVFPVHPNPNVAPPVHRWLSGITNVTLIRPLAYQELIAMANASFLVITDSGGLQEELPWLGKPVLVLRYVTERRAAVLSGAARLVGAETEPIVAAVTELMENPDIYRQMAKRRHLYGNGRAGRRIAKILLEAAVEQSSNTVPVQWPEAA